VVGPYCQHRWRTELLYAPGADIAEAYKFSVRHECWQVGHAPCGSTSQYRRHTDLLYASGKNASEAYAQTVRLWYCLVGPALAFFPAGPLFDPRPNLRSHRAAVVTAQISPLDPRPNFTSRSAPPLAVDTCSSYPPEEQQVDTGPPLPSGKHTLDHRLELLSARAPEVDIFFPVATPSQPHLLSEAGNWSRGTYCCNFIWSFLC
jgi:hypothetical protein